MVTKTAKIIEESEKVYIELESILRTLRIPLSEDIPNTIMEVFNQLIMDLKKGEFKYEQEVATESLYTMICEEYIKQLNQELHMIYSEMIEFELVEPPGT